MRKSILNIVSFLFLVLAFAGCRGGGTVDVTFADTIYKPTYATGFDIFSVGKSSVISIYDPWPGAAGVRIDLFLAREGEVPPADFGGVVVQAPLKRVVCMSGSHRAFIGELGQTAAIKGISGSKYAYDSDVRHRVEMGHIADVGYDAGINYELLASLEPDLVFLYGVSARSAVATKLDEMGIKSVHIGEFKESSPLGKAEWLVAFGEMFDLRHGAQRDFLTIGRHYNELAEQVRDVETRPTVMLNAPWRDMWHIPGDSSYMVQLIDDAAGEYIARGQDSRFSRPISLEAAWIMADKADFWLNPNAAASIAQVVALNPRFDKIPAIVNGRVYNNNNRNTPQGGSDFWESGSVRPDVILKDMIRILHPTALPDGELFYFRKLE